MNAQFQRPQIFLFYFHWFYVHLLSYVYFILSRENRKEFPFEQFFLVIVFLLFCSAHISMLCRCFSFSDRKIACGEGGHFFDCDVHMWRFPFNKNNCLKKTQTMLNFLFTISLPKFVHFRRAQKYAYTFYCSGWFFFKKMSEKNCI